MYTTLALELMRLLMHFQFLRFKWLRRILYSNLDDVIDGNLCIFYILIFPLRDAFTVSRV